MDNLLVAPHSLTLEQNVLGCLMFDCQVSDDIFSVLTVNDFYDPKHRIIFTACFDLFISNNNPDICILSEYLKEKDLHNKMGGDDYLEKILRDSPASDVNVMLYCQRVKELSIRRVLIKKAQNVLELAYNSNGQSLVDILDISESSIMSVRDLVTNEAGAKNVNDVAKKVMDDLDERYASDGKLPGYPTGFFQLDELTLGIEKKRLTIIGGRPSQGKTTLMMNILENMMLSGDERLRDKAGLVFTMEMENESIVENMIASLGKVLNYKIRKGNLDDWEWPSVTNGTGKLHGMNLYLDDRPARTLQDIRAEARRIKKMHKGGLAFIAVDYLQRMGTVEKFDTTSQKVGSFSAGLKRIAQDFDCPVIALAQLNRLGSQRPNKRPSLSDLRDSGEIEQDGDLIMFIHREEYYQRTDENAGKAELIIAKQRKGMCGTVHLDSNLHFCRFENPSNYNSEVENDRN